MTRAHDSPFSTLYEEEKMPEIIPLNATVHFKCAFDIKPEGVTKPMTHLRKS